MFTKYGITTNEALNIGQFKSLKAAIKNKKVRANLNDVGIQAANRDALLPQVDNRLLFTQSRTPWIRMMGQFLSWAQAKSASTNKKWSTISPRYLTLNSTNSFSFKNVKASTIIILLYFL